MHQSSDKKSEIEEICVKCIGDENEERSMLYTKEIFDHAAEKYKQGIFRDVACMMEKAIEDETYVPEKTPLLDVYEYIRDRIGFNEELLEKLKKEKSLNSKYKLPFMREVSENLQAAKDAEELLKYAMKITYA